MIKWIPKTSTLICVVLLLFAQVALSQENHAIPSAKIKAVHFSNGITKTKFMIKNKDRNKTVNITKIQLLEDNDKVLEVQPTPFLRNNPVFTVTYTAQSKSQMKLQFWDAQKKLYTRTINIKEKNTRPNFTFSTKNSSTMTPRDIVAITKHFGNITPIIDNTIQIDAPSIVSNSGNVRVKIQSHIKIKSITLFVTHSDYHPTYHDLKTKKLQLSDDDLVLACKVKAKNNNLLEFDTSVILAYGYDGNKLIAVVESENGKFYIAEKSFVIGICLDCGG